MNGPENLFAMEAQLHEAGYSLVCGVDEAGRGPLAGPVCAAAVILPLCCALPGLDDSKKLTAKKREALFLEIQEQAVTFGIAFGTVEEIEERNILSAALLTMHRAIEQLSPQPDISLIDGNSSLGIQVPSRTVIGGDGKCACIAAASILAKVTRDHFMDELAEQYPQYGFEKNKGYGTKAHYAALEKYGPSPVHRMSFLKKFYAKQ